LFRLHAPASAADLLITPTREPKSGLSVTNPRKEPVMSLLKWALIFLLISLVAALFGFSGISAATADIARILFFIFVVIFLVLLVLGLAVFRV
jgi:uncharacterized membrane protein YtjA (UPF0391 family)